MTKPDRSVFLNLNPRGTIFYGDFLALFGEPVSKERTHKKKCSDHVPEIRKIRGKVIKSNVRALNTMDEL